MRLLCVGAVCVDHPFVIPLTKIDVERRLVIGTAAEEIADKASEIMDYETAKPQFMAWSDGYKEATGGLSKGNLRVMHTKQVAGRLDDIHYDDATKRVQICAKIVDPTIWALVESGSFTGFSIGGGYLKKWNDPVSGLTRYTPIVREISLVDNPCMPTARFAELVKGDGMSEQLELHGVARSFADLWAARPAVPPTFAALHKRQEDGFPKQTPPTFAALHKAYDETKHSRAKDGEFSGHGQLDGKPMTSGEETVVIGGMVGGAAALPIGALVAAHRADAPETAKAHRTRVARLVRHKMNRKTRQHIVQRARDARSSTGGNAHNDEMAAAAHRKIMEEGAQRGDDPAASKRFAERFAEKVRGRTNKGGAVRGNTAARESIKTSMARTLQQIPRRRQGFIHTGAVARLIPALTIGGLVAGGLISTNAVRLKRWATGDKSD